MAPLLASLRGYVAEFLNEGSLERLGILALPSCVSLGTDTALTSERGFSRTYFKGVRLKGSSRVGDPAGGFAYQPPLRSNRNLLTGSSSVRRHPTVQTSRSGAGMLTCFPSITPFGLTLGSD